MCGFPQRRDAPAAPIGHKAGMALRPVRIKQVQSMRFEHGIGRVQLAGAREAVERGLRTLE
jgi:hypothetical protein